jgi:hypothetical protein
MYKKTINIFYEEKKKIYLDYLKEVLYFFFFIFFFFFFFTHKILDLEL